MSAKAVGASRSDHCRQWLWIPGSRYRAPRNDGGEKLQKLDERLACSPDERSDVRVLGPACRCRSCGLHLLDDGIE
ncbi:hypothetical protein BRAS3843_460006 [Bradyrhizobium sp. STM 3843]|nr:hypothetical protein BRAS3843_460006 [Bradyrhizobium sp. STM 3843]